MSKKKQKQEPQKEKWFKPKIPMGWHKDDKPRTRRINALKAHKGNVLSTARALNALANVTTDKTVKHLARLDAQYFFARYEKEKK